MDSNARQGGGATGTVSVAELFLYVVAVGFAVAGLVVAPSAGNVGVRWLLTTGASVVPAVLVVLGALWLRRRGVSPEAWRGVAGWYVAGITVATALVAWVVVGAGVVGRPAFVPGALTPRILVAGGSPGGLVGSLVGASRARDVRRRRAPAELLANVDEAAWLFDADRSETIYVNPAYEQLFGQSAAALAEDPAALAETVHPDDREDLELRLDRLAGGTPIEFEFRANPDQDFGRWVWLRGRPIYRDGEPDTLAFVAHDITSRRRHRERLVNLHDATRRLFRAESEEKAAQIATEAAKEVLGLPVNTIWLYDEERGELVPTAATEAAEATDHALPTFKSGNSLAWEVFESGEAQIYDDVRTAPGGEHAPTRSEVVLPLGEYGVFMAGSATADRFESWQVSLGKVLAANVEVALARIKRTRALEESRRALEQRNERLDEFTSVVSHDLRNPLAVAQGHLELVREECDTESVQKIDAALERMETLIEDLLTLSREGEAIDDLQQVTLPRHIEQCWEGVETESARLQIETSATIRADGARLAQLFENLFRNAVEHGATEDDPVTVTVGTLPDDDGFYVEDDGPGIPSEEQELVFEAGHSTASEGTGFGLSIVQTIAEAHGWKVRATESAAGGARFEITGVSFVD
ncbi:MAG: ATP-binding protein [Haloglomus sp.]